MCVCFRAAGKGTSKINEIIITQKYFRLALLIPYLLLRLPHFPSSCFFFRVLWLPLGFLKRIERVG